MDVDQVTTYPDFIRFLDEIGDLAKPSTGNLQEYLRSVLGIVLQNKNTAPSFRLLSQILADAFVEAPLPFDPGWLAYTAPPERLFHPNVSLTDPYDAALHILRYQIADLQRLQEAGELDNPYRYYGVKSLTGYDWYNFDPETFLICASSGLGKGSVATDCSWDALTVTLYLGQIYE